MPLVFSVFGLSSCIASFLIPVSVGSAPAFDDTFEPDPIFETIDLNATYVGIRRIFDRMGLTPKEMAVLIGGGHSSGQGTLEGGTYHGNWVSPKAMLGNAYFQLLAGHRQWCAVKSSDNGNAHFVAKGAAGYIAESEYSPLSGKGVRCVETAPNKALFVDLPTVPAEDLMYQPGIWHKPSGAAAMMPVDFALQYSNETYVHVLQWAFNSSLFFEDFQLAWTKFTELGFAGGSLELRCPNVNGAADFGYSPRCAGRFGDQILYMATWSAIRADIKKLFDTSPWSCKSIRPKRLGEPGNESSVCPSSVLRLGFHISATYDPQAKGNVGGSNFANFLGPCAMYDGCGGCLQDTQLALQRIQKRYHNVSLADVTIYAAGLAAAYLAEFKLNNMPFHPGRVDPDLIDNSSPAECKQMGARLPSPAYQWTSTETRSGDIMLAGMLSGDLLLPTESDAANTVVV
mmetsp:Transcript_52165/g.148875  ORF Transcript_52165/g.148875 Transcript_52165/m.148875 type:complete len:457 (-) Transcript_52165:17-1387(-)